MKAFQSTNPIFHDDDIARAALEALRWPDGPVCPNADCGASGAAVARMGGAKQSHRDGLYRCKSCRRQFTVTVGTVFASSKVPLSKWMRAIHKLSFSEKPPTLMEKQKSIGVTYKTTLQMWARICGALYIYRGYKKGFGTKVRAVIKEAQPKYADAPKLIGYRARKNKLIAAGRHPSQHTMEATGLLSSFASANAITESLERTERLLRLLFVANAKAANRSRLKRGKASTANRHGSGGTYS